MFISARCDYACRALLELCLHWPNKEPVQISTIAQRQNIPIKYLVHILLQLKRMGLVRSIRGKEGGYTLKKKPDEIRLSEIVYEMQASLLSREESSKKAEPIFSKIWQEIEEVMVGLLEKFTFADIRSRLEAEDKAIVYHI